MGSPQWWWGLAGWLGSLTRLVLGRQVLLSVWRVLSVPPSRGDVLRVLTRLPGVEVRS